jgi:hypothetical protein
MKHLYVFIEPKRPISFFQLMKEFSYLKIVNEKDDSEQWWLSLLIVVHYILNITYSNSILSSFL